MAAKKGRRTATRNVTDGALQGFELVLKQGVKLSGLAYLPSGRPAAGLEISAVDTMRHRLEMDSLRHVGRGESVSVVTNADGTYSMEIEPGVYRFLLASPPGQTQSEQPAALIAKVAGPETRLDFGPVPGLSTLAVRLIPKPGLALWLVRGDVRAAGNPPMEMLHTPWLSAVE